MVFGPIDACDLWARRGSNRRAAGNYVGVLYCPRASNLALADRRGLLTPCLPDWWGLTVDECLDRSGPMGLAAWGSVWVGSVAVLKVTDAFDLVW